MSIYASILAGSGGQKFLLNRIVCAESLVVAPSLRPSPSCTWEPQEVFSCRQACVCLPHTFHCCHLGPL